MTGFNYAGTRSTADRLITRFGQVVSIRRVTDSGTAWEPTQTNTDYATKGAKIDFSAAQRKDGNVQANDERWLVAAGPLAITVVPGDQLVVSSVAREIVRVDTLAPGGTVVLYDLQVRS